MKKFDLKFWLLAMWFGGSIVFLSAAAENTDVSLTFAAVVNLIFCASVIKARKDLFEEALKNIPDEI